LLTRVIADAVAEGLVARAAAAANAGRTESAAPAAAEIGADEPMPEWERDLLQPSAGEAGQTAGTPTA
jgi:small subunit ribosomal protein S2